MTFDVVDTIEAPPINPAVSIANGSVTVSNAPVSCVLIIASYNGTKLVDAKAIDNATSTNYTISDQISTSGATTTKAFLWNNTDDLKPLCKAASSSNS